MDQERTRPVADCLIWISALRCLNYLNSKYLNTVAERQENCQPASLPICQLSITSSSAIAEECRVPGASAHAVGPGPRDA